MKESFWKIYRKSWKFFTVLLHVVVLLLYNDLKEIVLNNIELEFIFSVKFLKISKIYIKRYTG